MTVPKVSPETRGKHQDNEKNRSIEEKTRLLKELPFEILLRRLMSGSGKPSASIRDFFGEEAVCEFDTILKDPEFVMLDAMQISEGMSSKLISHYARSLREFREVRCRLDALARKIVSSLRPKIEVLLRERDPNIRSAFAFVTELAKFFYITDVNTLRNSRITEFKSIIVEYLTIMIYEISVELGDLSLMRKVADYFKGLDEKKKREGIYFSGSLARVRINNAEQILDHAPASTGKKQKKTLKASLRPTAGNSVASQEIATLFDKIWDQATFDMVSSEYQRLDQQNAILITRKGIKDARALCEVHLIVNAAAYEEVVQKGNTRNSHIIHEAERSSIKLFLDKSTGELCLADTSITFDHVLGDPQAYMELKKKVYTIVHDHLLTRSMERMSLEDMRREEAEWLEMLKREEDEERQFAVELQTLMAEEAHAAIGRQRSETQTGITETIEQGAVRFSKSNITQSGISDEDFIAWKSLRGVKASRVCTAIEKILGEPVRMNGGSHRMYHSSRTGRRYPFPYHPSDPVNRFILRDCLEAWGISPVELAEVL